MSDQTEWHKRRAAIAQADGDEWDRLSDLYDVDWKSAYVTEFVRFAVDRNWTEENAAEWADEIARHALIDGVIDPVKQAQADVFDCERESANA